MYDLGIWGTLALKEKKQRIKGVCSHNTISRDSKPMKRSAHTRRPASGEAIEVPYRHSVTKTVTLRSGDMIWRYGELKWQPSVRRFVRDYCY